MPGRSRTEDVSTEVELDVPAPKRRAVVTWRLLRFLVSGGERKPARSTVPVVERSRELLEQEFGIGSVIFRCVSF